MQMTEPGRHSGKTAIVTGAGRATCDEAGFVTGRVVSVNGGSATL
jgi:hypothetical protein